MQWFIEHAAVIANVASLAMLFVWMFYTALFYRDFRRQRLPLIVVHQARGYGPDSTCLVVNMSKEPIHVLCVMMAARTAGGEVLASITDPHQPPLEQEPHRQVQDSIKQGPLQPGKLLSLGSIREILRVADLASADEPSTDEGQRDSARLTFEVDQVEVRVIALHGAYQDPIGACRAFYVSRTDSGLRIEPQTMLTHQMTSRAERRQVRRWLEACLPDGPGRLGK